MRQTTLVPVRLHLRGGHNAGLERPGHGVGFEYAHDSPDGWVKQDYLGVDRQYYHPVDRGKESEIRLRLDELRARRTSADD